MGGVGWGREGRGGGVRGARPTVSYKVGHSKRFITFVAKLAALIIP